MDISMDIFSIICKLMIEEGVQNIQRQGPSILGGLQTMFSNHRGVKAIFNIKGGGQSFLHNIREGHVEIYKICPKNGL